MSKKKPFKRIAVTLPPETLRAADELATRFDRSRSWIVAEAIRQFAALQATAATVDDVNRLGASRLEQLRRDAALSPEARVREAEGLAVFGNASGVPVAPLKFATYDDYVEWRRKRDSR